MNPELLAVNLVGAATIDSGTSSLGLWSMIAGASVVVQAVMFILLMFSVISWAIIIFKSSQLSRAKKQSFAFLEIFWKSRSLGAIYNEATNFDSSPVAQIFRVGYQELGRMRKSGADNRHSMENVERSLRRAAAAEATRVTKTLSFLATTGNTTPFIGLFGTVWGIMGSFREIGQTGAANLATVAPGISEALVATAAGLVAAIPAVIAYNHFSSRVRVLEAEMTNFMSDFLNILERDLLRRGPAAGGPEGS